MRNWRIASIVALVLCLGACAEKSRTLPIDALSVEIIITYTCDLSTNQRTEMKVEAKPYPGWDPRPDVYLNVYSDNGDVSGWKDRVIGRKAVELARVEASGEPSMVLVYAGDEELASASFNPDDYECEEGDTTT